MAQNMKIAGVIVTALMVTGVAAEARTPRPLSSGFVDVHQMVPSDGLRIAERALKQGKFEKAVKVLNRTLDNHPTADETLAAEANLCLAHTYLANYETAMDACNRALALRPVHWQSLVNRGNLYAMNGEAKAAIGDYRAAIKSGGDAPTISRLIVRTEKAIAQAAVE